MKNINFQFVIILLILLILSCKKDAKLTSNNSSLTIVNAVNGSTSLATNFDSRTTLHYFNIAQQISYSSFMEFGSYVGDLPIALADITDTTHNVYSATLNLQKNSIHTLFLAGNLSAPESFITTDVLPYHAAADSSIGIRFVNLSPGSAPISVNVIGLANGSEINNLAYKSITAFKNYSAKSNVSSYTFEFHDGTTGDLLASYTMSGINDGVVNDNPNQYRWRNFTIAFNGLPGAQGTFLINNY